MGFYEDDRIRSKNKEASSNKKPDKDQVYTLRLKKNEDLGRIVLALDMAGYKVELCEDGTTIIVR